MIWRLLCRLGWHAWRPVSLNFDTYRCTTCGKIEFQPS